ncbi:phosphoesterase [Ligilactobacillus sp. Marseille-Q7487]|uniref:phosphoesterase n=1 Tax=Ligilactobacillus sp. Marseille-Q7487 TaxID=3022128 RepID=UPI0015B3BEE2|nr:phosphoesterase [Ligilactobacillus sp. Marseille-Q7487]
MKKTQYIKLFSHNDLDGFGAPVLLETVKEQMFANVKFDLTTCSAGNLDRELSYWFKSSEMKQFTDVYIMDMTPDSEYSFEMLENHFANHWLIFDHHESEEELRQKYRLNCLLPTNQAQTPSATSLVWDWLQKQVEFANITAKRQAQLAQLVELIRAYDTWDWQNDPLMAPETKIAADELNQLFWFYPLQKSQAFVSDVFAKGWEAYRDQNELLIETLNERRKRYLERHLRSVVEFELANDKFGIVYASDYKSEIAHELLHRRQLDAVLVIDNHSVSLRSNGRIDVAKFASEYFNGGGHNESAGGTLSINPVEVGEQAVADELIQLAKVKQKQIGEEQNTLADQLDPEIAAKMAALFGKD